MIAWLDFHGGSHGSFLEYVLNVYVMGRPALEHSVFNEHGACHGMFLNQDYEQNKSVHSGHWSQMEHWPCNDHDPIIRIAIDKAVDDLLFVWQVNRWYRAGNVPFDDKFSSLPPEVLQSNQAMRTVFYYRLSSLASLDSTFSQRPNNPIFHFHFDWFFSYDKFVQGIREIAAFLQLPNCIDGSLESLWQEFIALNQGWQSLTRCQQALVEILDRSNEPIILKTYEEAWLIVKLVERLGIDRETLTSVPIFPQVAKRIHDLCTMH